MRIPPVSPSRAPPCSSLMRLRFFARFFSSSSRLWLFGQGHHGNGILLFSLYIQRIQLRLCPGARPVWPHVGMSVTTNQTLTLLSRKDIPCMRKERRKAQTSIHTNTTITRGSPFPFQDRGMSFRFWMTIRSTMVAAPDRIESSLTVMVNLLLSSHTLGPVGTILLLARHDELGNRASQTALNMKTERVENADNVNIHQSNERWCIDFVHSCHNSIGSNDGESWSLIRATS